MDIKKVGFAALFVVGAVLVATVSLKLTAGVVLMVASYRELRKQGVDLSDIDDILLEKFNELREKI